VAKLDESVAAAGRMWGGADYERVAQRFASVHDDLVRRLEPVSGERWLDVGTGTGEVALRAARAGAEVTAVDISQGLLAIAQAKPGAGPVDWSLGDAQALGFDDASFDVVVSCFAAIFASDHSAVARELARVCRPGGRLGLTAWRPEGGPHAVYQRFAPDSVYSHVDDWGKEGHVEELLGDAFELQFSEGAWHLTGRSPEELWELMSEGAPPNKALIDKLDAEHVEAFRQEMLAYWRPFETENGVDEPRLYLIVTGRRR
jgi:SAM-dependent methyltransferase